MKKLTSFCALLIVLMTGCYRMPTENDFSTIPTTNNRDLTREKESNSLVPNMSY